MAEKGGVAGIYLMPFLDVKGQRNTGLVVRHIEHAIAVCGEDHVGIGSDLSIQPIEETPEYKNAASAFVNSRKQAGGGAPGEDLPLYIPELNHPRRIEAIAYGSGNPRSFGENDPQDRGRASSSGTAFDMVHVERPAMNGVVEVASFKLGTKRLQGTNLCLISSNAVLRYRISKMQIFETCPAKCVGRNRAQQLGLRQILPAFSMRYSQHRERVGFTAQACRPVRPTVGR